MEYKRFDKEDVAPAAELLAARHRRERLVFPAFKREFEDASRVRELIQGQLDGSGQAGVCAYENGEMQGFLLSEIMNDDSWGRCALIKYAGNAIAASQSPELYRRLYAELAKVWLEYGALTQYAVIPAGDAAVVDAWLRVGFTYDHVFGMTDIVKREERIPEGLTIRKGTEDDAEALSSVSGIIYSTHASSPCFTPALPERMNDIKEGYGELPTDDDCATFVACRGGELVGFHVAQFIDDGDDMKEPEKAFELLIGGTVKECRGQGIGGALTRHVFNWGAEQGFENVVCDWQMANLYSSVFWPAQGFKPIAYRMYRRIDERVFWADGSKLLEMK